MTTEHDHCEDSDFGVDEDFDYYTAIPNNLLRDNSISPNCRWLLCYLLSHNLQKFDIRMNHVINYCKDHLGKNKVYALINEAMKAGYIDRRQKYKNNLKNGFKYFIAKTPKFLKNNQLPENPETAIPDVPDSGMPEPGTPKKGTLNKEQSSSYEEENHDQPKDIAQSAKKSRTAPPPRQKTVDISFSFEKRDFTNISDADLKDWKDIYTEVNIAKELKEMIQWVLSNPSKCKGRSAWRKFIVGWLKKSQEKIVNRQAYQQQKKSDVLDRHKGFQHDNSPRPSWKTLDFSGS